MFFKLLDNTLEINGSLHKLYNNGIHNSNNFSRIQCISLLRNFCGKFGIPPAKAFVSTLEFGLNFQTQVAVNEILLSIRFLGKYGFRRDKDLDYMYFAGTKYFRLKIYNKSLQPPFLAPENTLRLEWKTEESKYLRRNGCETLQDLFSPQIYLTFSHIILEKWDDILLFDFRKKRFRTYFHTEYWLDTIKAKCLNTFKNRKRKYYEDLGKTNLHSQIYKLMRHKLELLNDCRFSTDFHEPKYLIS